MQLYISIIIFISIFCVLSVVASMLLRKDKMKGLNKEMIIKTFLFYFAMYYGIIAMFKVLIGEKEETLFESFWDLQTLTYIHYGIPLLVISLIIPLVIRIIFKQKEQLVIVIADAIIFAELMVCLVCGIKLDNIIYVGLCVIAAVATLGYIALKKEDGECAKSEEKNESLTICAWVLWLTLTVISIPNEMYLTNISEFPIAYWRFLGVILFYTVLVGAVGIIGSAFFLPSRFKKVMALTLMGYSVMGYIQSMFLNGELAVMDGDIQVWPMSKTIINAVIWIIGISVFCVVGYYKSKFIKFFKGICLYIVAIQFVSLIVLLLTSDLSEQKTGDALLTEGALSISEKNNVIVFVLDKFDGKVMDEILSEGKQFVEPLKDFIYYENATSPFVRTSLALPYLLTGTEWNDELAVEEYEAYAFQNSSVIQDLVKRDYRVGIFSDVIFMDDSVKNYISNYANGVERKCNIAGTINIMTKCSRYRMAPFGAKKYYTYYSDDIVEDMVKNEGIWYTNNDMLFYNMLKNEGLSIAEEEDKEGAFLFYHMFGAHPPFRMTQDLRQVDDWESSMISQAKGSLKIVYNYMEQLKELGKYDETTIVIIADHGLEIDLVARDNLTSIPLILVKEANQSQDELRISSAPVSQAEFIPTIMKAIGVEYEQYGRTFAEVPENESNERKHTSACDAYREDYVIKGSVKDPENWTLIFSE